MIIAGTANLEYVRSDGNQWGINLDLESAGMVNRLYRVKDKYRVSGDQRFCPTTATLDAQEGKRHNQSHLTFDSSNHKLLFEEQDLVKNRNEKNRGKVPLCR